MGRVLVFCFSMIELVLDSRSVANGGWCGGYWLHVEW